MHNFYRRLFCNQISDHQLDRLSYLFSAGLYKMILAGKFPILQRLMKKRFIVLVLFFSFQAGELLEAQIRFCAWNLQNFGKSKSDSEIIYIAGILRDFDMLAVTEVVAGKGGAQAVARLADELNRRGAAWDYAISDPTGGNPYQSERYAYLWKTSKLRKWGRAVLEERFAGEIEREPFFITMETEGKLITFALLHAVPKKKQPEREISYLKYIEERFPERNIIFAGDFNCPQSHTVFLPLKKRGYRAALEHYRTTIKMKPAGKDSLASEFDNIFYHPEAVLLTGSGAVHFYRNFPTLVSARKITDHLPVWLEFELN